MTELQDKLNILTEDKSNRYFYHFTPYNAEKILEQGLIASSPHWENSFLEFTDEELKDIESVINDNKSIGVKQNNFIILVGVPHEKVQNFMEPLDEEYYNSDREDFGEEKYIVNSNYIIGYIDLKDLELYINEYSDVVSDNFYL